MNLTIRKAPAPQAFEFSPTPPRVNVLPPAARERAAARRARNLSLCALGIAAVTVGGLYANGTLAQQDRREQVSALEEGKGALTGQLAVYSPVTNVAAQSRALTDTVAAQTVHDVDHGAVLQRFITALGSLGTVQSLSLATDQASTACATTDPFNTVPLAGCLTFSVKTAGGQDAAGKLLTALGAESWFIDPFIPTVSASQDGTTLLTGSVGVTRAVYASDDSEGTDG